MGRFSTTVQVRTSFDPSGFIDSFCGVMNQNGFVRCPENEAKVSYVIAFGESWVTLASEKYMESAQNAHRDSCLAAGTIGTGAFTVEVVDSDFAILTLHNDDTIIVGDGSGYGFDEPERGTRSDWEPLLAAGKTWKEFSDICREENLFVEDTLSDLAEILGIDPKYIYADQNDLSEDESAVWLHFKKQRQQKGKIISFPGNQWNPR